MVFTARACTKVRSLLVPATVVLIGLAPCVKTPSPLAGADNPVVSDNYVAPAGLTVDGHSPVFSPDGRTVATADLDGTIKFWDVLTGKQVLRIAAHRGGVISMCYSPDGKTLASAAYHEAVKLWETATGKERATLKVYPGSVCSLAFAPNGRILATEGWDGTARIWDLPTGSESVTINETKSLRRSVLAFSLDSKSLLVAGDDGNSPAVMVCDVATGRKAVTRLPRGAGEAFAGPFCVAFSPDCAWCAVGYGADLVPFLASRKRKASGWQPVRDLLEAMEGAGHVNLWDVTHPKKRDTLKGHGRPVIALAFAPDGKTLASADEGGVVKFWEVATGKERASLQGDNTGVYALAFAPDAKILAAGTGGAVKLWRIALAK